MLQLVGIPAAVASEQAATILELETALAEVKLSPVEAADPAATYNRMTVAELLALTPHFDMATLLAAVGLPADQVALENEVVVGEPRYMRGYDDLLTFALSR